MFNGLHYNSISSYLKEKFGCKVVKLSLDAGLTCPNRDGSKGFGGCTFCSDSGSGDFAGTIEQQLASVSRKWQRGDTPLSAGTAEKEAPDLKYIAYFQNHTNTYAPVEKLRALWDEALDHENVVGLAIATRPDCLGPEVLDLLSEYNEKTFLWVELGLQTGNERTAEYFNRCWKNVDFEEASYNLSTRGIKRVTHLILGLPGEDKEQYISSAKYAASFDPFGIKIHMLHLMEGTAMGEGYKRVPFPLLTRDEYVSCVCDILEILPQNITVHRLTGDAPQDKLIAPDWTRNKHAVLNAVQQEFKRRGSYQGIRCENETRTI
ncbi:MAG: TIGR01212 family radical SAM protein [Firmicutes bacterium]|nr:TIGR01212 family radical SAM protein [Bacillota bacterium]